MLGFFKKKKNQEAPENNAVDSSVIEKTESSDIKNNDTKTENILSVFAGRIADTGIDPEIMLKKMISKLKRRKNFKILWASTREILNIVQADRVGCQIITVPYELISKINLLDKNLTSYSLETVKTFYEDALKSNYKINYKKI